MKKFFFFSIPTIEIATTEQAFCGNLEGSEEF
jgi:hypothetical protein